MYITFLVLCSNLAKVDLIGRSVLNTSWTLLLMWVGRKWVKVQNSLKVEAGTVELIGKWSYDHQYKSPCTVQICFGVVIYRGVIQLLVTEDIKCCAQFRLHCCFPARWNPGTVPRRSWMWSPLANEVMQQLLGQLLREFYVHIVKDPSPTLGQTTK